VLACSALVVGESSRVNEVRREPCLGKVRMSTVSTMGITKDSQATKRAARQRARKNLNARALLFI